MELIEEREAAHQGALHRPVINRANARANGVVEIGECEEGAVPQSREDPALRDLDTHLDFRFVGGRRDTRGNHDGVIVVSEFGVGAGNLPFAAVWWSVAALPVAPLPDF